MATIKQLEKLLRDHDRMREAIDPSHPKNNMHWLWRKIERTRERLRRKVGRPRIELEYEFASSVWQQMREEDDSYLDRFPTDREFRDRLAGEYGVQLSQDTLARRKAEWSEEGLSWPPGEEPYD